jgi:uncharacterized RDD family membrane protein YckC
MYVASTFRRIVAHLSDELLGSVFWIPLLVNVFAQMGQGHTVLVPWTLLGAVWLGRMAYEIICIYVLQALPVQYFLGLRMISTYHPEMGLGLLQITIRVLVAQLKYLLGPSIYFMALFHRERQHLGDILAETRVVQTQERWMTVQSRAFIGSILVYSSLVTNLGQAVDLFAGKRISAEGIKVELPQLEIDLQR